MVEYYFDIETTGLDPTANKIISIQRQPISFGKSAGPIEILKEWKRSEKEIIKEYLSIAYPPSVWDLVYIGTNLLFDFHFINERAKHYALQGPDFNYCREHPHIDLKHVLLLLNEGKFRGYSDILNKGNRVLNEEIPQLYEEKKYKEIVQYITNEASATIDFYGKLLGLMPTLKNRI